MLYDVITSFDKVRLVEKVSSCLMRGWKLQGGVSVSTSSAMGMDSIYAQAITFEEPKELAYYEAKKSTSKHKEVEYEIH